MGLYEPMHQMSMWGDFKGTGCLNASATTILQVEAKLDNQVPIASFIIMICEPFPATYWFYMF